MKLIIFSILFLFFLQTSFAQKYEYNILGERFSDTLSTSQVSTLTLNSAVETGRKATFEMPEDTIYMYHQVGEGENVEYILNLYQLCAPCFAEWNAMDYPSSTSFFTQVITQKLYEGEYLKVALKKQYQNGMSNTFETRTVYTNFSKRIYTRDIMSRYGINRKDLFSWNNLDANTYYIEDRNLITAKIEYKYSCPCFE